MHLRTSEITLPKLLKDAGYATCHSGKWHLNGLFNNPAQPQPGDHGYDWWMATQNNAAPSHKNPVNFVRNGSPVGKLEDRFNRLVGRYRDPQVGALARLRLARVLLAMDRGNLALLLRQCPPALRERVGLYADLHETFAGQDVPDPYYGGASGFERVLDMVEAVSAQLLARLRAEIGR